jgi:hypothetical protein
MCAMPPHPYPLQDIVEKATFSFSRAALLLPITLSHALPPPLRQPSTSHRCASSHRSCLRVPGFDSLSRSHPRVAKTTARRPLHCAPFPLRAPPHQAPPPAMVRPRLCLRVAHRLHHRASRPLVHAVVIVFPTAECTAMEGPILVRTSSKPSN